MLRKYEMVWRPNYEAYAALGWAICLLMMVLFWYLRSLPTEPFLYLSMIAVAFFAVNAARAWRLWGITLNLCGKGISFITDRQLFGYAKRQKGSLWLGKGFDWASGHSQRLYELKQADPQKMYPPAFVMWLRQLLSGEQVGALTRDYVGAPWIHGVEPEEKDIYVPLQNFIGNTLILGTTRCGKAQPLDAKVHTPQGWRKMGDLKVGDSVSTPDGASAKVVGVFPQGCIPIYKMTFADGRTAEACGEHLWEIHHKHWNGKYRPGVSRAGKSKPRILTTLQVRDQLATNKGTFKVRLPAMVEKPSADLAIDPYVLGCFLGDGLLGKGMRLTFCNEASDVIERIRSRLPTELALLQNGPRSIDYTLQFAPVHSRCGRLPGGEYVKNPYKKAFAKLGLDGCRAWEKFIPVSYKEGSIDQRLEVLRGLMDTDGEVSKGRRLNFYTTSMQLAVDVQELVWSLGGYAKIHNKQTKFIDAAGIKRKGRPSYRVAISHTDPRLLLTHQRRMSRLDGDDKFRNVASSGLAIQSIEYSRESQAQCIAIDHSEHLYITDNYVVTHNTRMLEIIVEQAIMMGHTVIMLDPKGDQALEKSIKAACKAAGREHDFLRIHLAFPRESIRIDLLKNYTNPSDLATRVSSLMPGGDKSSSFRDFAWGVLNAIILGMLYVGEKPTLVRIRGYVENGIAELLLRNILKFMDDSLPQNWEVDVQRFARTLKQARGKAADDGEINVRGSLGLLVAYYAEVLRPGGHHEECVEALSTIFRHDSAHYGKMIANLIPILAMLTTGELGPLLSPNADDVADARPITDNQSLIRSRAVLYFGLDSLANQATSSAVGSMYLSDMTSVAAAIYNYEPDRGDKEKIFLVVDESSEVVNEPYITMLNKSAGAGVVNIAAAQTVPDFSARFESMDKARQMLGNFNNMVAMRLKDKVTQEFAMETFGETYIKAKKRSLTNSTGTKTNITHFTGSIKEETSETLEAMVPPDTFGKLPNWQYFGSFSGGRVIKARLPIISHGG